MTGPLSHASFRNRSPARSRWGCRDDLLYDRTVAAISAQKARGCVARCPSPAIARHMIRLFGKTRIGARLRWEPGPHVIGPSGELHRITARPSRGAPSCLYKLGHMTVFADLVTLPIPLDRLQGSSECRFLRHATLSQRPKWEVALPSGYMQQHG